MSQSSKATVGGCREACQADLWGAGQGAGWMSCPQNQGDATNLLQRYPFLVTSYAFLWFHPCI